jgi:hypothetical protein
MFCIGRVAYWLKHGHLFVVIFKKLSYGFPFFSIGGGGGGGGGGEIKKKK